MNCVSVENWLRTTFPRSWSLTIMNLACWRAGSPPAFSFAKPMPSYHVKAGAAPQQPPPLTQPTKVFGEPFAYGLLTLSLKKRDTFVIDWGSMTVTGALAAGPPA